MKPGWTLTSVGGVRYDGTHYCIEHEADRSSIIHVSLSLSVYKQIYVSHPLNPSDELFNPHIVDKQTPPMNWSFHGSDKIPKWMNFRSNYQFIQLPRSVIIVFPLSSDYKLYAIELPVDPQHHYPADICRFVDSESFHSSVSSYERFSWVEWLERQKELKLWEKHL